MYPKIENSFELLVFLKNKDLLKDSKDEFWWENSGSFEVAIGVILVQNTKWENVKISLQNLKNYHLSDVESLANCDLKLLESLIIKCGFFRQKAQRLQNLSKNIIEDFGDFKNFKSLVTREWLLQQKGIGFESADAILNYSLYREIMVVDRYTQRLLVQFGFEFDNYDDIQSWLQHGIVENYDSIEEIYYKGIDLAKVYARFHAKIVEFSKQNKINKR